MKRSCIVLLLALGCGDPKPVVEKSPAAILAVAEHLESEHKTKQAFAAYRQIARQFPDTPEGRTAAERIGKAQRDALAKPRK